jgi:hypothetical protein
MTASSLPNAVFDIVVFGKSCYFPKVLAPHGNGPLDSAPYLLTRVC